MKRRHYSEEQIINIRVLLALLLFHLFAALHARCIHFETPSISGGITMGLTGFMPGNNEPPDSTLPSRLPSFHQSGRTANSNGESMALRSRPPLP